MFIGNRTIMLIGDVDFNSIGKVMNQMQMFLQEDPKKEINLHIASTGGSVMSGFAMHDFIKLCGAPVSTVGIGEVSSAAIIIWLAATKGKPRATENTFFVLHELSSTLNGAFKTTELSSLSPQREARQKRFFELIAKATGRKHDEIERISLKDTLFNVDGAIKFGLLSKKDVIRI